MKRIAFLLIALFVFGFVKYPIEKTISDAQYAAHYHGAKLDLSLREQIGRDAFIAALSGFRGVVADYLVIWAFMEWDKRHDWSRVFFLYNQIVALQPRSVEDWKMGAWYMAYQASSEALRDEAQPREALRVKASRQYIQMGREFLERGIRNNPDRFELYNELGSLLSHKTNDHYAAYKAYANAARFPDCMGYEARFAAYELSKCPGKETEAYALLKSLYQETDNQHSTLLVRLQAMEEKLGIPPEQRVYNPKEKPQNK